MTFEEFKNELERDGVIYHAANITSHYEKGFTPWANVKGQEYIDFEDLSGAYEYMILNNQTVPHKVFDTEEAHDEYTEQEEQKNVLC